MRARARPPRNKAGRARAGMSSVRQQRRSSLRRSRTPASTSTNADLEPNPDRRTRPAELREGRGHAFPSQVTVGMAVTGIGAFRPLFPQRAVRARAAVVFISWLSLILPSGVLTTTTASSSSMRYSFCGSRTFWRTSSAFSSVGKEMKTKSLIAAPSLCSSSAPYRPCLRAAAAASEFLSKLSCPTGTLCHPASPGGPEIASWGALLAILDDDRDDLLGPFNVDVARPQVYPPWPGLKPSR